LCGYILERDSAGDKWRRKEQFLPSSFSTAPQLLPDGELYSSIVDSTIAGGGNAAIPLLAVAASLKSSERMTLAIADTALLYVDDKLIPREAIKTYVNAHPLVSGKSRVWCRPSC